jgi:gluconokinase
MLNFQTCSWDEKVIQILRSCENIPARYIMNLLPELVDFDGTNARNGSATPLLRRGIPRNCGEGKRNPYWDRWPELRGQDGEDDCDEKNNTAKVSEVLPHCRLFLGIGDGAAANLGSKCDSYAHSSDAGRRIAVTIGTSAAARVCIPLSIGETVAVPYGLFCYRVDKTRVIMGGALTDGGSVVEWARTLLNLQSREAFEAVLDQVAQHYDNEAKNLSLDSAQTQPIGAVTMIPFLSGERSTGFRGSATACISGITRETTSVHILYACLEGVTLRLAAVIDLIGEVWDIQQHRGLSGDNQLSSQTVLVVSGNALERNSLWRQMIADCTGFSVVVDGDSTEGTCRGVAMLIARSFQTSEQSGEPLSVVKESRPNSESKSKWSCATLDQESLINAVSYTWKK